jgi:SAM-dependent methyltransferase
LAISIRSAIIYNDFYDRIAATCVPGAIIEIGGGVGNLKERLADVIATDAQFAPWLDAVADAQRLPFAPCSAANIVMIDVLHHLEYPAAFFREAQCVLRPGGRVVMVEPAITWGSTLFYRLLHHEPVCMSADILKEGRPNRRRNPYDSNQAIPTLLATRDRNRFHSLFPDLRIVQVDWFAFAAYPMSGGFKSWNLISKNLARCLLQVERRIESVIGRFGAFRMMLVIDKVTKHGRFVFDTSRPDGAPQKLLNVSELTRLGWHGKTPLRDGIAAAYSDFLANGGRRSSARLQEDATTNA